MATRQDGQRAGDSDRLRLGRNAGLRARRSVLGSPDHPQRESGEGRGGLARMSGSDDVSGPTRSARPSRSPARGGALGGPHRPGEPGDGADGHLVEDHLGLARYLARRFAHRGEAIEDLEQVASMGLVEAATRYDPSIGTSFPAFATATIIGTLKKHFRDRGWAVRVSRRVQELYLETRDAVDHLSQRLGRSPNIEELAEHLGVCASDVLEAMEAGRLYRTASLSQALDDDTTRAIESRVGAVDPGVGLVERRDQVRHLMSRLPVAERRVVLLRFQDGLSQAEIGSRVGVSQMQVSRLLARGIERMRAWDACA